ncbi:MAG: hypothetical protein LBI42_13015 [Chitinispirillales bacterium]|nr:hypothetical protein [Chitinispirillales bacterium]
MSIQVVPLAQCAIPDTDMDHYITGIYALNLPNEKGDVADWHDVFHWRLGIDNPREISVAGINMKSSNHLYGEYGVKEGREQLVKKGLIVDKPLVYVANYCRAVIDMIYDCLAEYDAIYNLTGAVYDWLYEEGQEAEFFEKLEPMKSFFKDKKRDVLIMWIDKERSLLCQ